MSRPALQEAIDRELKSMGGKCFEELSAAQQSALITRVIQHCRECAPVSRPTPQQPQQPTQPTPQQPPQQNKSEPEEPIRVCCKKGVRKDNIPMSRAGKKSREEFERTLSSHLQAKRYNKGNLKRDHQHIQHMNSTAYPRWWPRGYYCSVEGRDLAPKVTEIQPAGSYVAKQLAQSTAGQFYNHHRYKRNEIDTVTGLHQLQVHTPPKQRRQPDRLKPEELPPAGLTRYQDRGKRYYHSGSQFYDNGWTTSCCQGCSGTAIGYFPQHEEGYQPELGKVEYQGHKQEPGKQEYSSGWYPHKEFDNREGRDKQILEESRASQVRQKQDGFRRAQEQQQKRLQQRKEKGGRQKAEQRRQQQPGLERRPQQVGRHKVPLEYKKQQQPQQGVRPNGHSEYRRQQQAEFPLAQQQAGLCQEEYERNQRLIRTLKEEVQQLKRRLQQCC